MLDLQKATFSKRISAFLFDIIAMFIVVVGLACVISAVIGYDNELAKRDELTSVHTNNYGIDMEKYKTLRAEYYTYVAYDANSKSYSINITDDQLNSLDEKQKTELRELENMLPAINLANRDMLDDEALQNQSIKIAVLEIFIIVFSILISFLLLEFLIPLWLGNGQTIGKKIFGIGVMKVNGVKVGSLEMFVRAILAKYTLETMVPVFILLMFISGIIGGLGLIVLLALIISEIIVYIKSGTNSFLHDTLSLTVCVDIQSQMIFNSEEELIAYKEEQAAEAVGKQGYGSESIYSVYSSRNTVQAPAEVESSSSEEHNSDQSYSSVTFGDAILANSDVEPKVEQADLEVNTDSETEVALEEDESTDDVQADEASEGTEEGSCEEAAGAESDNEPCEDEEKEEEIEESSENDDSDSTEADNADESEREKASDSEQE